LLTTIATAATLLVVSGQLGRGASAQEPSAPQPVSAVALQAAIDKLGDLDYEIRTAASRTVRRTPPAQAVAALLNAVAEHADGYVRYRALVLLTGFNDPRTIGAMRESMGSANDRLRTVAYSYFERNPSPAIAGQLLAALDKELAEFVRPALVRALAANAADPEIQQVLVAEARRGEDFFRSAVIEALGDYKAAYAYDVLTEIAKLEGPLQDDAALALGKVGDKRALSTLAALQGTAPRATQPVIAAAICLLGVNCTSHENYLVSTLAFADQNVGFQDLLRGAASGLAALGVSGREPALTALLERGIPSRDPTRAPVALAVATIALRNTPVFLPALESQPRQKEAVLLVAEGFDMLEEDLEKERFFALVRRTYWGAAAGSGTRALMQTLIDELNF
jgi:HEAT repeat protein